MEETFTFEIEQHPSKVLHWDLQGGRDLANRAGAIKRSKRGEEGGAKFGGLEVKEAQVSGDLDAMDATADPDPFPQPLFADRDDINAHGGLGK